MLERNITAVVWTSSAEWSTKVAVVVGSSVNCCPAVTTGEEIGVTSGCHIGAKMSGVIGIN